MFSLILATPRLTPVDLNKDRNLLVTSDGSITVIGADAITASDGNNVLIDGDINVADGIGYVGPAEWFSKLTIGVEGSINSLDSEAAVLLQGNDEYPRVSNSYFDFTNAGTIQASGGITAGGNGVVIETGTSNTDVVNSGVIIAELTGISSRSFGANITNSGQITSIDDAGMYIGARGDLLNTGLIEGEIGVETFADIINIENAGTISGRLNGISFAEGDIRLQNSGEIFSLGSAIRMNGQGAPDTVSIFNTGLISGSWCYTATGGAQLEVIRNAGAMVGRITLGEGDDRYIGIGDGYVEGTVFGEEGRDDLRGSDADDVFDGGAGLDRLDGGAGNDSLTGGDGLDIFVFSRVAGDDVIEDFENGRDRIDLSAYGLKSEDATIILDAATDAGAGRVFLDLDMLGGSGSILVKGLELDELTRGDFVFVDTLFA